MMPRLLHVSLAMLLLGLTACATQRAHETADYEEQPSRSDGAVVTARATLLRARPTPGGWELARLPAGTQLKWVRGATDGAFSLVVRPGKGPSGWVRSADLQVDQASLPAFAPQAACATDLSSCPTKGCAAAGTPAAILNQRKRDRPTGEVVATLGFDDFTYLQEQADELVGSGRTDVSADERAGLTNLEVIDGKVSEGDKVKLIGYLPTDSSGPHPNSSGESVNCKLKGSDSNDFHIPITEDPSHSEFDAIVIEMIPQRRPASWTTANLKKVQRQELQVWIEGGLFYDNIHVVNNDPEHPLHGQPKRYSLWEIHPVTKFLVCREAPCDPDDESTWSPL